MWRGGEEEEVGCKWDKRCGGGEGCGGGGRGVEGR